jgi:quinol monooxygenase YgiN
MSKVAMIVKLPCKPGKRDELVAAFAPMMENVNSEAGTEIYILSLDTADEDVAWVYELYTDNDALTAHSGSDTMATLIGALGDTLGGAPDFLMTTPVSGKGL